VGSYPRFPQSRWGVIPGPSEQPQTPPAREPEPPGEFVSEDLRADCTRFLEDLRALVGRRAESPAAEYGWVPGPGRAAADGDVGTPPRWLRRTRAVARSLPDRLDLLAVAPLSPPVPRLPVQRLSAPAVAAWVQIPASRPNQPPQTAGRTKFPQSAPRTTPSTYSAAVKGNIPPQRAGRWLGDAHVSPRRHRLGLMGDPAGSLRRTGSRPTLTRSSCAARERFVRVRPQKSLQLMAPGGVLLEQSCSDLQRRPRKVDR